MKWLVLPPHRDVTLVPDVPEGWHLLDLARDFTRRVFSSESVEAECLSRESSLPSSQTMRELLLLRVAQGLRERSPLSELRALGAVLTAISGAPQGVHLRLDDVELESGTTERSADVQRVSGMPSPYSEDVAAVLARLEDAQCVRLWLERDLQLPAAASLAQACPPHVALEVAGPFASTHHKVLARMPAFRRATFPEQVPALRWRVRPLSGAPSAEDLVWISDGLGLEVLAPYPWGDDPDWAVMDADGAKPESGPRDGWLGRCALSDVRAYTGGARWAGHVSLGSLLAADVLVESGCHTAVVGFCGIENGRVVDPDHCFIPVELLVQGYARLKAAGVRVVAEWWVGAPGVDEASLEATLAALEGPRFFDHLAGVRPFHASVERIARVRDLERWWGNPGDAPADRDLSRSRPIERPGTIDGARRPAVLASLASRLMTRAPLSPGRVAAGFLLAPPVLDGATHIRLDADCAVVCLPATLEGTPKPSWYAANLRTGGVVAMDARLAPALARLTEPTDVTSALPQVPEAQRAKLVEMLVTKSILERTRG
ncbi:hypothetical protein LXT21_37450 [Myxococcus sp. K38C18041901]|uniref:hypothetical protein n=1 Tax=Myxococcus guangdongensis TaxID=2906760 RepID=UPI0020A713B0|nr:hypothetical protein [Myxococcus guangdongensis]MCP3064475.1 hypothetical protein [Myxococcus guangdongensis]